MERFKGKYERELPVRRNVIGSFIPIWNIIVLTNLGWRYGTLAILTITLVSFALLGLFILFGVILGIIDYDDGHFYPPKLSHMPLDDMSADCMSWDDQLGDCETVSMTEMEFVMTNVMPSVMISVLIIAYLGLQGLITWYFIKKHNTRVRANNSSISPN